MEMDKIFALIPAILIYAVLMVMCLTEDDKDE